VVYEFHTEKLVPFGGVELEGVVEFLVEEGVNLLLLRLFRD
jgi:hypothetical protein